MSEDDRYPEDSGRRRFVKGVVGGATLAGTGAVGATVVNSATTSAGQGGGATRAMAIENIAGPAPRGMPQIPIEIDDEGYIRGVWPEVKEVQEGGQTFTIAETENYKGTDVTYSSEWFQYCGVQSYKPIQPTYESDNYFRVPAPPFPYDWMSDLSEGDRFNVSDFGQYNSWGNNIGQAGLGQPAVGTWRSQDAQDVLPIQIIRSKRIEEAAQNNPWVEASTEQGVIAWLNKCTHFCCVPGYKQSADSAKFNAANEVYCQCHQSVYNPFSIVETLFTALPRPE